MLGLVLCLAWVPAVRAQCVYTELESDVSHLFSPPAGTEYFQFEQNRTNWMAIAVRPTTGFTPQILIYQSMASYPACVGGLLGADEQAEGVSVVVGNFNRAATGIYYGALDEVLAPSWVPLEWDAGNGALAVNDSMLIRTMDEDDVVDVWDVFLEAGTEYGFQVTALEGDSLTLLLFDDADIGANWEHRTTAVLDEQMIGPLVRYTPVSSGDFAVVVIKESVEAATYGVAVGACVTPTPIHSGVSVRPYGWQNYYEFDQQWWGWTAIGMLSDVGVSDLVVYVPSAPREYPTCFTQYVIQTGGYVGVVARNFTDTGGSLPGVHYIRAGPSLESRDPILEWEGQSGGLTVNGPPVVQPSSHKDILAVWDVELVTGEDYTFHVDRLDDVGPYWLLFPPRETQWVADYDAVSLGSETTNHTATETGSHGLVALDTSREDGTYKVCVSTCGEPQSVNPAPTTYLIPAGETYRRFSYKQLSPHWGGAAISSDANWDLDVYEHACGGAEPVCFSGLLSASDAGDKVDFVVGDFNRNPLWRSFVHAEYVSGTPADAHFQWAVTIIELHLEEHVFRVLNPPHVLEVLDVPLIAGHEYQIYFEEYFSPDGLKLFVFEPSGDTYWAHRGEHVLEATSSTSFTPSITGSYGFAVVNETTSSITYEIGISSLTVSAQPGSQLAGIQSLIPNPTSGSITIEFGVTEAQPVSFEIIDAAGRSVARLPVESMSAGTWTRSWNGISSSGNRPPTGVYFVRMKSGGAIVDLEKFVLLE